MSSSSSFAAATSSKADLEIKRILRAANHFDLLKLPRPHADLMDQPVWEVSGDDVHRAARGRDVARGGLPAAAALPRLLLLLRGPLLRPVQLDADRRRVPPAPEPVSPHKEHEPDLWCAPMQVRLLWNPRTPRRAWTRPNCVG